MAEEEPKKENQESPEEEDDKKDEIDMRLLLELNTRLLRVIVSNPKDAWGLFVKHLFTLKWGFVIVFFGLLIWGVVFATGHYYTQKFDEDWETNETYITELNDTNSYYRGVVTQTKADKDDLQKKLQDTITTDNENLREKDVEIGNLKNDNDALQTRVTFLQALPNTISDIASNMATIQKSTPTNMAAYFALGSSIQSLTNQLEQFSQSVTFSVSVNGVPLTNSATLEYPTNGNIQIMVKNTGSSSASELVVDLMMTVAATNVTANGWNAQPSASLLGMETSNWSWQADKPIPVFNDGYYVASIQLSTNLIPSLVVCRCGVYSANSKGVLYMFAFAPHGLDWGQALKNLRRRTHNEP